MMALAIPGVIRVFCKTHGEMHYRVECDWWRCAGFDGEGCTATVPAEYINEMICGRPLDLMHLEAIGIVAWQAYREPVVEPFEIKVEVMPR